MTKKLYLPFTHGNGCCIILFLQQKKWVNYQLITSLLLRKCWRQ